MCKDCKWYNLSLQTAFLSTWKAHKIIKGYTYNYMHICGHRVYHTDEVWIWTCQTCKLCQHWSHYLLHLNRRWCYRISNHLIRQGCGRLLTLTIHLKQEAASIHQSRQVTMAAVVKGVGLVSLGTCFWKKHTGREASSTQDHSTAEAKDRSSPWLVSDISSYFFSTVMEWRLVCACLLLSVV